VVQMEQVGWIVAMLELDQTVAVAAARHAIAVVGQLTVQMDAATRAAPDGCNMSV
jgi:hypothetical protein